MKITPVKFGVYGQPNFETNKVKQPSIEHRQMLPMGYHHINFNGYSDCLKGSLQWLEKNEGRCAKRVELTAKELMRTGNPDSKRLIDAHKQAYAGVLECRTLDALKENYPEFRVIFRDSDEAVHDKNKAEKSIAGIIKSGESKYFNKDESLPLQLVKYYWGMGFSLDDLGQFFNGKQINHTFEKYNIPKFNNTYGRILQDSRKKGAYEAEFSDYMLAKGDEVMERARQEKAGERVYIPKHGLTEGTNNQILNDYLTDYVNNPEKCLNMTDGQKEFFGNNPNLHITFKQVIEDTWKASRGILKKISKTIGATVKPEEFANQSFDEKVLKSLQGFYQKNGWAKEAVQESLLKTVDKMNRKNNEVQVTTGIPRSLRRELLKKVENPKDFEYASTLENDPRVLRYAKEQEDKLRGMILEDKPTKQRLEDAYMLALVKYKLNLDKGEYNNLGKGYAEFSDGISYAIDKEFFEGKFSSIKSLKIKDLEDIQESYGGIALVTMESGCDKLVYEFEEILNKAYKYIKGQNDNGITNIPFSRTNMPI